MKAVVTGASGFIGSHLVERLLREGLEVLCIARPSSDLRWLAGLPVQMRPAGLDDERSLAEAFAGADVVFHAAGLTRARSAAEYFAVNVEGTRRALAAAMACGAAVRRFVYISSLAAVGPAAGPQSPDETAEPHPLDASYGASKLAAERLVLQHAARLPVTILRPPAVYGPRDTNFLPLLRLAARRGRLPIAGRGDKRLTLIHVADLVEGAYLAASTPAAVGQTYFLGGGTYTMEELAAAIAQAVGRPIRILRIPAMLARLAGEWGQLKWAVTRRPQIISRRKVRDALQDRWTCSWAKAQRDLGYQPQVALADGMAGTVRWYADHGWL